MPRKKQDKSRYQKRSATDVDTAIGQRVRQLRMQAEMSQEELAKKSGVSFQQVQKYEKGVNRLSVSRLLEFCKTLNTTPNEIIGWETATPKGPINTFSRTVYNAASDFVEMPDNLQVAVRKICDALMEAMNTKR